jgi:hypothetical protein
MSIAKVAAFSAALLVTAAAQSSAQSAQATLKAPAHMTRARLAVWCKSHPTAVGDCKEVRADNREIHSDRKEVRSDRKELRADVRAGDKKEARQDARELKADRKDTRLDRKDRRQDVRDARK